MASASASGPDRRALLALVLGASAIGCGPVLVRTAQAGPAAVGFWRLAFALPLLALLARAERKRGGAGAVGPAVVWAGLLFAGDLGFWHYGIHYTSVANATVLSNLTPVLVTAVSWALWGERPRPLFVMGLLAAVGGAALMAAARGGGSGPGANPGLGDLLSALCAVWYSGYFLAVRAARARAGTAAVMWRSSLVGAPAVGIAAVLLHERLLPSGPTGWAACAGLGLMHVAGQGAIAWALGRLPASLTAVVVLVQPVVAAALGWLVFGEAVTPWQAAGGGLALAGVALAQLGARRSPPPPVQGEAPAVA